MALSRFNQSMARVGDREKNSRIQQSMARFGRSQAKFNQSIAGPRFNETIPNKSMAIPGLGSSIWAVTQKMTLEEEVKQTMMAKLPQEVVLKGISSEAVVTKLTKGDIPVPGGICIFDGHESYLLYRSDKKSEADALFKECGGGKRSSFILPSVRKSITKPPVPAVPTFLGVSRRVGKEDVDGRAAMKEFFQVVFPQVEVAKIEKIIKESGGDEDLVLQNILEDAPEFRVDPEGWFNFWDTDHSGWLDKGELAHAVAVSMQIKDTSPTFVEELVLKWFSEYAGDDGQMNLQDFLSFHEAFNEYLAQWGEGAEAFRQFGTLARVCSTWKDSFDLKIVEYMILYFVPIGGDRTGFKDTLEEFGKRNQKEKEFGVVVVPAAKETNDIKTIENTFLDEECEWSVFMDEGKDNKFIWEYLAQAYSVYSFPSAILVDKQGTVLTREGVRAITEDPEAQFFPWKDHSFQPNQNLLKLRRQVKYEKMDTLLAEEAADKPITQQSYKEVAESLSTSAMRAFVDKVLSGKAWTVMDDAQYASLIAEHVRQPSSLDALLDFMEAADWIHKAEDEDKTDDSIPEAPGDLAPITEAPSAPSKGKGKGIDVAPSAGKGEGASESNQSEVGKGKKGPPTKGKGKGKGKKGGPPSKGKGKNIPAPPGGKGKGAAGKGKGKSKGPQPTRPEKEDWLQKKTNKFNWKRLLKEDWNEDGPLKGDNPRDPVFEWSFFACQDEAALNMDEFTRQFALETKTKEVVAEVKVKKPNIWEDLPEAPGVKAMDNGKRKQLYSMMTRTPAFKSGADGLVKDIDCLGYDAILESWKDTLDQVVGVAEAVSSFTDEDIRRLQAAGSQDEYTWDNMCEGFFMKLTVIPKIKQRMTVIPVVTELQEEVPKLEKKLKMIRESVMGVMTLFVGEKAVVEDEDPALKNSGAVEILEDLYNAEKVSRTDAAESTEPFMELFRIILTTYTYDSNEQRWKSSCDETERANAPFRKLFNSVLTAGDCLNAGDARKGRADGYDIIQALKKSLLTNMPKGNNNVSLMDHMKNVELTSKDREQVGQLVKVLCDWKYLADEEEDYYDLAALENEYGKLFRTCKKGDDARNQLKEQFEGTEQWSSLDKRFVYLFEELKRLDTQIVALKDVFPKFLDYLTFTEWKEPKDKLCAGRILGIMNALVVQIV